MISLLTNLIARFIKKITIILVKDGHPPYMNKTRGRNSKVYDKSFLETPQQNKE